MSKWQRDTWQPPEIVGRANGVMPHDVSYMLPSGTIPQVDQGMPQLPSLSFPQGDGAPATLPVRGVDRSTVQPVARRVVAPTKQRAVIPQEKAGEDRTIPGMAKGNRRLESPQGDGAVLQRGDRERVASMLDAESAPVEDVRRMPAAPRGGGQEKRESQKRIYLPQPQLITPSLMDDAMMSGNEEFIAPGAMGGGELMELLPLLMMMQGQGMPPMMGQGMPQGMPPMGQWQERGW